jgi:hypothetical protein
MMADFTMLGPLQDESSWRDEALTALATLGNHCWIVHHQSLKTYVDPWLVAAALFVTTSDPASICCDALASLP